MTTRSSGTTAPKNIPTSDDIADNAQSKPEPSK